MFFDFLEMSLYPSLLFIVPLVGVAIMLGISDYMDSKEGKSKRLRIMKTIKINPKETGWISIPCDIKTIVAHFNDGHKETMPLFYFATMSKRKKSKIVQIDCYKEGEEIK